MDNCEAFDGRVSGNGHFNDGHRKDIFLNCFVHNF